MYVCMYVCSPPTRGFHPCPSRASGKAGIRNPEQEREQEQEQEPEPEQEPEWEEKPT